jgi:small subunit ribosomal protein S2
MARTNFDMLLEAGCHFGHLKRKWCPAMAPYIYTERNGIHIIDLHKTVIKIDEAAEALKNIARQGKKILFVGTKKQTKDVIAEKATSINMPYVIERWPGGMLTNFPTIRKAVKKMANIDKLMNDGTFGNLSKRELLQVTRQRAKLEKNLGSIVDMTRLPSALFVIDVQKENIAVREANRLGIPVFGIVDTNSDPKGIDFIIPANDDAKDSVEVILNACCAAITEGLEERKAEKADEKAAEAQAEGEAEEAAPKRTRRNRKEEAPAEEAPAAEEAAE